MRTRTAVTVILVATLLLPAAAAPVAAAEPGASDCAFPVELTDASGETLRLEERPERVTTTNPSAAQTMWEIGAREKVVGISGRATYLNDTDGLPIISN